MNHYPRVLPARKITGSKVLSTAGEELGNLKDVVVDLDEGRITYAVLSFGGFLGLGDKLFAIPWEALIMDMEENTFILDVDKEALKHAPGFDKESWPNDNQYEAGWLLEIYDYYGYSPYWVTDHEEEFQK